MQSTSYDVLFADVKKAIQRILETLSQWNISFPHCHVSKHRLYVPRNGTRSYNGTVSRF